MRKALIKSDMIQVINLIKTWAQDHHLTVAETSPTKTDIDKKCVEIEGRCRFYTMVWQCQTVNGGITLNMALKPKQYIIFILNAILLGGLLCYIYLIKKMLIQSDYVVVLLLIVLGGFLALMFWWNDNRFSMKLIKTEKSFWDMASQTCTVLHLTRLRSHLYTYKYRLVTEISLSAMAIYLCTIVFDMWGFVSVTFAASLLIILITAESLHNSDLEWNWRLWIISNMGTWTFVMLKILGLFVVLVSVEVIIPTRIHQNHESAAEIIKNAQFRDINPATPELLESNCRECFYGRVNIDIEHPEEIARAGLGEAKSPWVEMITQAYCVVFLVIMAFAVYFFSISPLYLLLKEQNTWKYQFDKETELQCPFVPYLPQAWKWEFPNNLRILIFFHWLLGGILNVAAALLCFDGLGYLFVNHTFFFDKTANLWSWLFTSCKIVFGADVGHRMGGIFVIIVSLPLLFLLTTYLRRCVLMLVLLLRALPQFLNRQETMDSNQTLIRDYAQQICLEYRLAMPIIVLIPKTNIRFNVHWLPIIQRPMIELTQGSVELLEINELKAAIAHEMGHIKQGLWKISALKLLSSLALFPNYYLTLCVDWAKKEIEADQFALNITKDAQSLKQAMIKLSTAQLSYFVSPKESKTGYREKLFFELSEMINSVFISVNFFFGDGIFGYTHPYLSERLNVIDMMEL